MTNDPFEQLRLADEPAVPDPRFAARLRARLVAALDCRPATDLPTIPLPERTTAMTDTIASTTASTRPGPQGADAADPVPVRRLRPSRP